ncbi:MAG: ATP synthase F1 subunit epsilon [Deltaproteobacteria bacterium]|nr:ATP synthase F1 subunit epsilon [Deltaproteobacteria bacterium]MBM4315960.1 ATP synthase F1 subunit epsilon [Deltaproteobacteria bacterium]
MLKLDIVTPTKKLVEGATADNIKLPGAKGELEILDGHTDLLTLLKTGPLVFTKDGRERKFAISYGFAEIRNNKVLVLADTVEESKDVDKARAQTAQKRAEQALIGILSDPDFRKQQLKLERALVRQQISH